MAAKRANCAKNGLWCGKCVLLPCASSCRTLRHVFRAEQRHLGYQYNNAHDYRVNDGFEGSKVTWNCPWRDRKASSRVGFPWVLCCFIRVKVYFGIRIGCWCASRARCGRLRPRPANFSAKTFTHLMPLSSRFPSCASAVASLYIVAQRFP